MVIITSKELTGKLIKEKNFLKGVSVKKANVEQGFLNIQEVLKFISGMGVNRLLVEGGARVWTSFLETGFFDEVVMFTGNKIMNNTATSAFNDFLPINTRLRDFPNLTLKSLLKWEDNIEAKWIASS